MTAAWLSLFDIQPDSKGAGCRLCGRVTGRARQTLRDHMVNRHLTVWQSIRRVRGQPQ